MARALRSGARRVLGRHDGPWGRRFDAHYRALVARHGAFTDALTRDYASAVAAAWVSWWKAEETLAEAERQRANGRGRRPSAARINQLQKRKGLEWQDYNAALTRLEMLAAGHGHEATVEELLRQVRTAAQEAGGDGR